MQLELFMCLKYKLDYQLKLPLSLLLSEMNYSSIYYNFLDYIIKH